MAPGRLITEDMHKNELNPLLVTLHKWKQSEMQLENTLNANGSNNARLQARYVRLGFPLHQGQ